MSLSKRVLSISESATLKLNARVRSMRASGEEVLNFTTGEPDFHVHDSAKEAVFKAVRENQSRYTPVPGIPELRELVAQKSNRSLSGGDAQRWSSENVVVSNGAKQALMNALLALIDEGDEVLIPAPFWVSYPEMVKIAGGVPRFISTCFENQLKISPEQLKTSISPKTKVIMLNSPSNPTGAVYTREEYEALGEILKDEKLFVLSDEIYDRIVFPENRFCSFLEANPSFRDRTIVINGMSKSCAMTGWRIGWAVANLEIAKAMVRLQGQMTSGANALAQWASVAALNLPEEEFVTHLTSFSERRDTVLEILGNSGKMKVYPPQGAFYAFVGVGAALREGEDSVSFCERLLEEKKVAVVPGTPFGEPNFVRLSFATDLKTIQEGCERIVDFVEKDVS